MQKTSISPFTGKSYNIPCKHDSDKAEIDKFLSRNEDKPIVVIQGLGFVGSVMSLVCANSVEEEYAVIGIDLPSEEAFWKVASFREGVLPLSSSDPKVEEFFANSIGKRNHFATFDPIAFEGADVIIVDVNLDVCKKSRENGQLISYDVDLSPFKNAIKTIAEYCKPEVLVIVETTVPPGTCMKLVLPILEEGLAKRNLPTNCLKVGHSYERVMPGPNYIDSIQNFYRVYSGVNPKSADATETFLRTIIKTDKYPLTRLKSTSATEIAKVLENSYRAANIAFMVEWSRFAEEAGVDIYEVVNAIRMRDTHKNIMLPGIGVGGYCLTKDPLLASWSRQKIYKSNEALKQSEVGVRINDQMPLFAFQFFVKKLNSLGKNLEKLKILLLGVSYRGDVGDTRYSPVELFYNLLISSNSTVFVHDFYVRHWDECSIDVNTDINSALECDYDVLVFTTAHSRYRSDKSLIESLEKNSGLIIFDSIGFLTQSEIEMIRKKHNLFTLGDGS